jgi:Uma2 family endonuclease
MAAAPATFEHLPLVLRLSPAIDMTDRQFYEFCRINRDLRIERTARGDLLILAPAGGRTGDRNAEITFQLRQWATRNGEGVAFDSSTGFRLPNGAVRSPDAAWVRRSRLAALRDEEKDRFLPLCPDFVIELRSPSDEIGLLRDKMEEYRSAGAQLGWLIDPVARHIHVYEGDAAPRDLVSPVQVSADPILPGFVLRLTAVWTPSL